MHNKELKELLDKNPWLRHLFNKLNRNVKVKTNKDDIIKGKLRTISVIKGRIDLEIETDSSIYFINWRNVVYLKVDKNDS